MSLQRHVTVTIALKHALKSCVMLHAYMLAPDLSVNANIQWQQLSLCMLDK